MKHHSTNKSFLLFFFWFPSRQALFLHCLLETCPAPTPHLQNLLSHRPVFYFRLYGRFYICLWEFLPILLRSLTIRISFWHSAHILSSYFLTLCGASFSLVVKLSARIFLAVASDPANIIMIVRFHKIKPIAPICRFLICSGVFSQQYWILQFTF